MPPLFYSKNNPCRILSSNAIQTSGRHRGAPSVYGAGKVPTQETPLHESLFDNPYTPRIPIAESTWKTTTIYSTRISLDPFPPLSYPRGVFEYWMADEIPEIGQNEPHSFP